MNQDKKYFTSALTQFYPRDELSRLWDIIQQEYYNKGDLFILRKTELDLPSHTIDEIIDRLKHIEPIDYIIGYKPFLDLDILVDHNVLIPRAETEEMTYNIIQELKVKAKKDLKILDIGSGSGCISLALKKSLPQADVTAIDVSTSALKIVGKNARLHQLKINYKIIDFLIDNNWESIPPSLDVIVSNPPYIGQDEIDVMDEKVIKHEPLIALFATDEDPLIFYKKIAVFAQSHLSQDGVIYLECNALQADKILDIFNSDFNAELIDDLSGLPRVLKARMK